MERLLIENARIINEGAAVDGFILVEGDRISDIGGGTYTGERPKKVIDADGMIAMPGVIDDQVHFREPGLTHKGDIRTESLAAVAGGVTSFMEMPNTVPQTTTIELLDAKFDIAAHSAAANYSFYLGATNDNIGEIRRIDPSRVCGVKVFMGSSTGGMLVDEPRTSPAARLGRSPPSATSITARGGPPWCWPAT